MHFANTHAGISCARRACALDKRLRLYPDILGVSSKPTALPDGTAACDTAALSCAPAFLPGDVDMTMPACSYRHRPSANHLRCRRTRCGACLGLYTCLLRRGARRNAHLRHCNTRRCATPPLSVDTRVVVSVSDGVVVVVIGAFHADSKFSQANKT